MTAVLDTVAGVLPDLPNAFSSLSQLAQAEEEDAKRIRPSRVGWWRDVWRVRGSTISRSWQACSLFTLWATCVAVADLHYGRALSLTNNVTPLLSVVVGLLLVFRNGSAYTRWDDGRKTLATMTGLVRSLARTVWINVGAPSPSRGRLASDGTLRPQQDEGMSPDDHEDKVKVLRLLVAFVVAVKHHVRGEYGMDWPDLDPLLPPKFKRVARTSGFGWGAAEDHSHGSSSSAPAPTEVEGLASEIRRLRSQASRASLLSAEEAGHSHPHAHAHAHGLEPPPPASPRSFHSVETGWTGFGGGERNGARGEEERRPLLGGRRRRAKSVGGESMVILSDYMAKPSLPLPLIIAHQLSLYWASCKRRNLLESVGPAGFNALNASVAQLVDCFTTCESLAKVGIPCVYGIHLKQCTSLFLFTLPLVLVELMGFAMIPFVTVVSFIFVGIEAIATAIEMPFGIDDSDLSLDLFCAELRNEVEHTISRLSTATEEWEL
ncbi:Bestrophin, RFP-TM, chloride channel-domain-containing protein [Rhodotorula diobovata]|uniref:Bestrophin, RFP-TM, chloride channel-domain-containing protein n=1 Tax=Rhodotorula diobovata TaxID=5288 RepID=A0A5C5FMQ2_9BASI|nr:Bestrophin, RFP-TM, chloride channel-domain-containing protein [Rhodotorula diobovata]